MHVTASDALYKKGLQLAERNDLVGALACIQEHLVACPRDGEALNDAGTILAALGRPWPVVEHLRRALEITGDPRYLVNLAETPVGLTGKMPVLRYIWTHTQNPARW